MTDALTSPVWLTKGRIGTPSPGTLELAEGRISFTDREGKVFDAPVADVKASFPRYYLGLGFKLAVAGETYKVYFTAPSGHDELPGSEGRKGTKKWKEALEP